MTSKRAPAKTGYRGRLAPTPTGYLHLGHARTFLAAQARAEAAGGELILRVEDLDRARCKPEYVDAMLEDLAWAGLRWSGEPVFQSRRAPVYLEAWRRLRESGAIYACECSRKDVAAAIAAPHGDGSEPLYPGICRNKRLRFPDEASALACNWRFRVPDGEAVEFEDGRLGARRFVAGRDFGDFLVWRRDGIPAYELAVVADDAAMGVTEVVRGEDLLLSTARQLLLYRALGAEPPAFHHCELVRDAQGRRLAKRDKALGLRELRARGVQPEDLPSLP